MYCSKISLFLFAVFLNSQYVSAQINCEFQVNFIFLSLFYLYFECEVLLRQRCNFWLEYTINISIILWNLFGDIVTEYYRMPPLYELDDYDKCMFGREHPEKEGVYCITKTLIQPNSSSDIWKVVHVS